MSEVNEQAELKGDEIKPSPRFVMIVHGVLAFLTLAVVVFVVPIFQEMYEGVSKFPILPQLVFNASGWCRYWIAFVVPVFGGLIWLDGKCYRCLAERLNRKAALFWFWGVSAVWVGSLILIGVALCLPFFVLMHLTK